MRSLFCLDIAGASLVSVEDSAEASFLTYIIEPLEGKTSTFWTGMYRNVDGNFFNFDFFFLFMNNWHKLFDIGVKKFYITLLYCISREIRKGNRES